MLLIADSASYTIKTNKYEVEKKLQILSAKLFKQFRENRIKEKRGMCHFLSSLDIKTKLTLSDCSIENSSSGKVLGVIKDINLNFHEHVTNLRNQYN